MNTYVDDGNLPLTSLNDLSQMKGTTRSTCFHSSFAKCDDSIEQLTRKIPKCVRRKARPSVWSSIPLIPTSVPGLTIAVGRVGVCIIVSILSIPTRTVLIINGLICISHMNIFRLPRRICIALIPFGSLIPAVRLPSSTRPSFLVGETFPSGPITRPQISIADFHR